MCCLPTYWRGFSGQTVRGLTLPWKPNSVSDNREETQQALLPLYGLSNIHRHAVPLSVHLATPQASATSLRVIDVSAEALDAAVAAIGNDRRVAEAFLREPWPPLADFLQRGGTSTLLEFVQHTPGER